MDSASWTDRYYETAKSQMSLIGADAGYPNAGYGKNSRHSANAYPVGGNGWTGFHWENPEIDAALDAVFAEFDPEKRIPLLQEVCRIDSGEPDLHRPLRDDPLLVRQQPGRQLRQHPWPGHGQLLQGLRDVVPPRLGIRPRSGQQ